MVPAAVSVSQSQEQAHNVLCQAGCTGCARWHIPNIRVGSRSDSRGFTDPWWMCSLCSCLHQDPLGGTRQGSQQRAPGALAGRG